MKYKFFLLLQRVALILCKELGNLHQHHWLRPVNLGFHISLDRMTKMQSYYNRNNHINSSKRNMNLNSSFEINGKRFKSIYPPSWKELKVDWWKLQNSSLSYARTSQRMVDTIFFLLFLRNFILTSEYRLLRMKLRTLYCINVHSVNKRRSYECAVKLSIRTENNVSVYYKLIFI